VGRSHIGACLVAAAALLGFACGGDEDALNRANPGLDLKPITAFEDRAHPSERAAQSSSAPLAPQPRRCQQVPTVECADGQEIDHQAEKVDHEGG